jgi:hypothetical protein
MKNYIAGLCCLLSSVILCKAAVTIDGVTTGTTRGNSSKTTTYNSDGTVTTSTHSTQYNSDGTTTRTTTYQNGVVTKVYQNGVLTGIYQDGQLIDAAYYGNLITVKKTTPPFDLRNEKSVLYVGKFELYLRAFLDNNKISESGRFIPSPNSRTPLNDFTRNEFRHFVAENRPTLTIDGIERCENCSGTGRRPGVIRDIIQKVPCPTCNARGQVAYTETIVLSNSAALPKRPTIEDFISIGMITSKQTIPAANGEVETKEKQPGMLLNIKKLIPATEPPKPAPIIVPVVEKKREPEIELTPIQRFQMIKGKAEAGSSQDQYELALYYLQEFGERPVPLDWYEAYNWMLKAATKNHRIAQFHLGRLYDNGWGTDKSLETALKWRRSAALLGCKQSQRWMGQLYLEIFNGNTKFAALIKQDPSNLIEAYAWFNLAAKVPFPPRLDPMTPGPDELADGDVPLNIRDYNAEKSVPLSAGRDRDGIPRNPVFNRQMFEDSKARCITLAKEAEQHRAQNRPK